MGEKPTKINRNKILKKTITGIYNKVKEENYLPSFNSRENDKLFRSYESICNEKIDNYFKNDWTLSPMYKKKIVTIIIQTFTKGYHLVFSGIVISGFGDKEIFPSLYSFNLDSVVNNKISYKEDKSIDNVIDFENNSLIVPFAQKEMPQLFMNGIAPNLFTLAHKIISNNLQTMNKNILKKITFEKKSDKDELKSFLTEQMFNFYSTFNSEFQETGRIIHTNPIMDSVSSMPKEDLGIMAETLVNLTSFKRKVSADEKETVGGPIDVAVISKGDGFVWIKRKHYFTEELNKPFFINYK